LGKGYLFSVSRPALYECELVFAGV